MSQANPWQTLKCIKGTQGNDDGQRVSALQDACFPHRTPGPLNKIPIMLFTLWQQMNGAHKA